MRAHTCTHKTSHRPHARLTTPHHSDTLKAFNPVHASAVHRSCCAVWSPVSAIDPYSEGNGAAYPLRLSESVACLLLAADGVERTDDWEEENRGGRLGGEESCFITPGQWRGSAQDGKRWEISEEREKRKPAAGEEVSLFIKHLSAEHQVLPNKTKATDLTGVRNNIK